MKIETHLILNAEDKADFIAGKPVRLTLATNDTIVIHAPVEILDLSALVNAGGLPARSRQEDPWASARSTTPGLPKPKRKYTRRVKSKARRAGSSSMSYPCDACEYVGNTQRSLGAHKRKHKRQPAPASSKVVYVCYECDDKFTTAEKRAKHIAKEHKEDVVA
jgi:hypothetical protein